MKRISRKVLNSSPRAGAGGLLRQWCPPCKKLGPTLEALAEDLAGRLTIVKVNVDKSNLAGQFGVMNIPTMIIFQKGQEVKRLVGNQAKSALEKTLEPYLA